ncbi:hypothetical protein [Staphylococcus hyicus]|uniref:hypothetical protein n=1 Tax=Staphylococcus hyicus TaxID=1284 RepID=UPI00211CE836|nr:hypothetical protein [Staphylococcus hyicus]MCQ9290701.1 hypothetical protein [Staphylococcus hyicus]MCQ9305943.1 hypothetical protein [Staphylococcus hyicus]MCQ9308355.1 hypothetical protein [Staphylococcus hyicus]MCQ9310777.1 hypothetical protein [Staphylococcus hyicus]
MAELTTQHIVDYIDKMPTTEFYENMDEIQREQHIFNAHEEVNDLLIKYPNVTINARMVALQALYNIEAEEEGIAMLRRQGIKDYTVKDVKATLDTTINPRLLDLIESLNDSTLSKTKQVGRLI